MSDYEMEQALISLCRQKGGEVVFNGFCIKHYWGVSVLHRMYVDSGGKLHIEDNAGVFERDVIWGNFDTESRTTFFEAIIADNKRDTNLF